MDIQCSAEELFILKKIGKAAAEIEVAAFVIGGFVRDKILGRPTKDADIVCLGNGIELAEKTAKQFHPNPEVNIFKTFGTAQIKIYNKSLPFAFSKGWDGAFEIEFV